VARAAIAYLLLALALTWPLARHVATRVPHDLGDPLLITYLLNWNASVVPFSDAWWNPPYFWPHQGAMTLSEHVLGLSLFATPLQWLGLSALTSYNLLFIASFWSAGMAGWWLGRTLTGNDVAAFVGGLAFMFAPYRATQLSHLQMLASAGLPVAFAALHRALSGGWKWPIVAAVCWLWQGLTAVYYLLYLPIAVVAWLVWFAPRHRGVWWRIAVSCGAAAVLIAPLLWRYDRAHVAGGFVRGFGEVVSLAADVTGLWQVSPLLVFWGNVLPADRGEQGLFPGIVVIVLACVALTPLADVARPWRARTRALVALAVVFGLAALAAAIAPGQYGWSGLHVSLGTAHKPLGVMWVALLAAAMSGRRTSDAWRSGSAAAGYAVIGIVAWILSLGPEPQFNGHPIWYAAPYWALFAYVPGFDELRVPARFWMITLVALSALASIGVARMMAVRAIHVDALTAALVVALMGEGVMRFPLQEPPAALPIPPEAAAVLEVPAGDPIGDATAMYRSLSHHRPVLNGWSGYTPPSYARLVRRLEAEDAGVLREATARGPIALVIDTDRPYPERYLRMAAALGASCEPHGQRRICLLMPAVVEAGAQRELVALANNRQ
jgi:hypothetical protein